MRQGRIFLFFFALKFPENFTTNLGQTLSIALANHSVKLWNEFLFLSKPNSSMHFLTSFNAIVAELEDEMPA